MKGVGDFGNLQRYSAANAVLPPTGSFERRVVFLGDSITELWDLARWFPGGGYINRGIGGQTTGQMLARFRQDVIDLHPAVVVILAGTNDVAGKTGRMTLDQIEKNYTSMAERAREQGISVIFSSVLPVHFYSLAALKNLLLRPPGKIRALNAWLQQYCSTHGLVYLDYYSAMIDERGLLRKELARDGVHPNEAGYAVMAPLAQAAIFKAGSGE